MLKWCKLCFLIEITFHWDKCFVLFFVFLWAPMCVVLTCPVILAVERPKCLSSWLYSAVASKCVPVCVAPFMCVCVCVHVHACTHTCVLCFRTCAHVRQCVIEVEESWKIWVLVSVDLAAETSSLAVAASCRQDRTRLWLKLNLGQFDDPLSSSYCSYSHRLK